MEEVATDGFGNATPVESVEGVGKQSMPGEEKELDGGMVVNADTG